MRLWVDAQFLSPWAMTVFAGLVSRGVPFDLATVDLGLPRAERGAFSAIAPTGRVPVLEHAGLALAESSAIIDYLEDVTSGPPLLPAAPQPRAEARMILSWLRTDLAALRAERPTEVVFRAAPRRPLSGAGQQEAAQLVAFAAARLHGRATLFEEWCIADTDLALALSRLGPEMPLPPDLAAWRGREMSRPAVADWCARARAACPG